MRQHHADNCAVIVDCANYYRAVYEAIQKARQSVFIVGWDIDSRIELLRGDDRPDPERSYALADVLKRKAQEAPDIRIYLLKWASSFIYAKERESLPVLKWRWKTPSNVHFCMDDAVPSGCSHHQKIIVVDDQIAFSGGMDIALGRWDTREHKAENPLRTDPGGAYRPYRDIQMLVDGEAATALADLVRWRWRRAAGFDALAFHAAEHDVWPENMEADFQDIGIHIAQTFPAVADAPELREIEPALLDHIAAAEDFIYIENQYLSHLPVAEALNRRLHERPGLKVLIVSSYGPQGPLEKETMWQGRIAFREVLERGLARGRARMVFPVSLDENGNDHPIHIHSKLMFVDDKILHVGSANLNGRSMGLDTECDLFVTAQSEQHRLKIAELRDTIIAEHEDGENGRALRPIDDSRFEDRVIGDATRVIGDPDKPPIPEEMDPAAWRSEDTPPWRKALYKAVWGVGSILFFIALWHIVRQPGTVEWIESGVTDLLAGQKKSGQGFLLLMATYIVLTLFSFPVTVLITLTASVYGPFLGFAYALAGSLAATVLQFGLGHLAGIKFLHGFMGTKLQKIDKHLEKAGVGQIAVLRMVPVAPFGLINLAAGLSSVPFLPFMAGTALGMLPGTAALAVLGHSLASIVLDLSLGSAIYLAFAVALWIGVIWATHKMVQFRQEKRK